MFVCFEGIDGAGKSTQVGLLKNYLQESGFDVISVCDPGTTKLGKAIRQLVLECDDPISANAQMLLFSSARAELTEHIRDQLQRGKIILCDRWLLSTLVYQSHLNGVDPRLIADIFSQTSLVADLCVLLDIAPKSADARKQHETRKDRFERVSLAQKNEMRAAYLRFAVEPAAGRAIHIVNADRPQHQVSAEIVDLFFNVRQTLSSQLRGSYTCQWS
jgi:dTMP kinase